MDFPPMFLAFLLFSPSEINSEVWFNTKPLWDSVHHECSPNKTFWHLFFPFLRIGFVGPPHCGDCLWQPGIEPETPFSEFTSCTCSQSLTCVQTTNGQSVSMRVAQEKHNCFCTKYADKFSIGNSFLPPRGKGVGKCVSKSTDQRIRIDFHSGVTRENPQTNCSAPSHYCI